MDILHEVAKMISVRSELGFPIKPEEVLDLFKDTFERMTEVRIIEMPVFMPITIEKEDNFFIARCHAYRVCKGLGTNEDEAIQNLKEEIDLYNKTCIDSERKTRMEEMVKKVFPRDPF